MAHGTVVAVHKMNNDLCFCPECDKRKKLPNDELMEMFEQMPPQSWQEDMAMQDVSAVRKLWAFIGQLLV